jgi:uncharacterized damage-inducible protein DinB
MSEDHADTRHDSTGTPESGPSAEESEGAAEFPARSFGWSDMFLAPEDDPRDGRFSGERAVLTGRLRDQRLTLEMKCSGLDAAALARRSVPPSDLSLLGLVRHMADVERSWFRRAMAGQDAPLHYRTPDAPGGDFDGAAPEPETVAEAWATWRAEVAFGERFVAENDLGATAETDRGTIELRDVLVHMVEEYARHNGHADLLRERIDGRVGE